MWGALDAHALQQGDEQVLITVGQGRRVQAPLEMLRRREDGSYFLPLSLRQLTEGTLTLQSTGGDNIVAVKEAAAPSRVLDYVPRFES